MQRFTAIFAVTFIALGLVCLEPAGSDASGEASGASHCARDAGPPVSSTPEPLVPTEGESACGRHCASADQGAQPASPTTAPPPAIAIRTRFEDLAFDLAVAYSRALDSRHRAPPRDLIALNHSFLL